MRKGGGGTGNYGTIADDIKGRDNIDDEGEQNYEQEASEQPKT